MFKRNLASACVLIPTIALLVLAAPAPAVRAATAADPASGPTIIPSVNNDVSIALTAMPVADDKEKKEKKVKPHREIPGHQHDNSGKAAASGSAAAVVAAAPALLTSFEGIGNGFSGPNGTFSVNSAPPDTNGAVGPNHYVETVNTSFAIFNKSGTPLFGPVPINQVWSGFGGGCQANNDGDPTVVYDGIADRWIISQFSVTTTPYLMCVAVSTSGDPTGSYYRYSFGYGSVNFPDYPKLSVWPDAYYLTVNFFANGITFAGAGVAALDRSKMLNGQPATQQLFQTSTAYGGLLASTLDGSRLPPAGTPNYLVALGTTSSLATWKYHVDWTTPSGSTFSGPTSLAVGSYAEACAGGTCIPQSGTTQRLDSLADRVMYRLAYRNFGDHEALVVNHSVTVGSSTGLRWYELRPSGGSLTIFQQGTYAPDASYRWMGSIAMDQAGGIGLGFSVSSSSLKPQIHYTGRLASDPAGQMTQGEGTIINGPGVQTGRGLSRWGDYSSMSIDPADGCTFWYANEYIPANGSFNWSTRIGTFKLPGCGAVTNDFSISASPSSVSATQNGSATSTIATAVTSGSAQAIALSASGLPSGATASFSPASVAAGAGSTLTLGAGTAAPGTYPVTVTGTGTSATHGTTVTFTITAPVANDFSISATPASLSLAQGASGTSTVSTGVTSGAAETVSLTVSGTPAGATATLSPTSVTAGGASTLTVGAGTAAPGTYPLTVTGAAASATHATTVTLTVTAPPPPNDFSISASPANVSAVQGGTATSTISTAVTSGTAESVTLAASGLTSGTTASFTPAAVTAGGSSTLTLSVGAGAATGSSTVTITGTGASATHNTAVSLTVTAPPASGIINGDFESGLTGWTTIGSTATSSTVHGGLASAMVGSSSAFNGDSSVAQTFTAPSSGGNLSFFYRVVCTDSVTYDWATATLRDNTAGTTATILAKTCTNSGTWNSVSAVLAGSHSYTLTLIDHDDNYATDPTYTLYDDVRIGATPPPPPSGITNGGFESALTGWTVTGSAGTSATTHSGTASARVGSTSAFNGDSSVAQTFNAPAAGGTLTFWYRVVCTDSVTYDWATATLRDNTAGTTATLLARTCNNNGVWISKAATLLASHSYTLTLIDHDDNYATDPTYTLYDDVTLQ